ncbi:inorganic phosphate transporter [uncultured Cardiobacterium sp.]|uniref:inorganic phosphate transporter n=1 Tax=uncultured Cardiobacterium sp. TaxID=417619 RepID=UPI0026150123|nr:inorganic phosphate transporter [uncultured Cardiobacterium sp.]
MQKPTTAENPAKCGSFGLSQFLVAVTLATVAYFVYWGLGYTGFNYPFLFLLACAFGLFMAFNIGGNDVANSFGTSVGAGTLSITQALIVAIVFEVSGALIAGREVTDTISAGIVDLSAVDIQPLQFIYIMMSALIAAALWLLFASCKGLPVSTTHSIIGGIVGASIALGITLHSDHTFSLVYWHKIWHIVASWVISPVLGGVMSWLVYGQIKKHVLMHGSVADHVTYSRRMKSLRPRVHKHLTKRLTQFQSMMLVNPDDGAHAPGTEAEKVLARRALRLWIPLIATFGALMVSAMLLLKGLKNLNLGLSDGQYSLIIGIICAAVWFTVRRYARRFRSGEVSRATYILFSWMQVVTASGFAFSHGSNDIANAIGPFAAIIDVLKNRGINDGAVPVPTVAMIAFGVALVAGLWFIGREVIATVGTHLAEMSPAAGFTAELAAAMVVMLASSLGLPVSSTHILVGAILGIGLVNRNANWRLMKPIALAWLITVPAAGICAAIAFFCFNSFF